MNETPRILAIETSGRHGSVVIAQGEAIIAERDLPPPMRHAAELMPKVRELVSAAGWRAIDIDQIYLSLGPGSFTGLRIAVAAARAMVQAIQMEGKSCALVGVPSLDVIAQNAAAAFPVVVPILDAKRGQVFAARYERDASGILQRTEDAALVDPRTFLSSAAAEAQKRGGNVGILGEGIDYHREALKDAALNVTELEKPLWHGRARAVLTLGREKAERKEFITREALLPIYIRLPEAEEVWQKKQR